MVVAGDVISLQKGLYTGPDFCNLTVLISNISIIGDTLSTIIDCSNDNSRHMTIAADHIRISGIKFVGGIHKALLNLTVSSYLNQYANFLHVDQDILPDGGGCMLITGSNAIIEQSWFFNCSSDGDGGAININTVGGVATLKNLKIENCTSLSRGGALFVTSTNASITDSNLSSNVALKGGGIQVIGNNIASTVIASSIILRNNVANKSSSDDWMGNGGGIGIEGGGAIFQLSTSALLDNSATLFGGAIFVGVGAVFSVSGTELSRNRATLGGGAAAFFGAGTAFQASNITLLNNTVTGSLTSTSYGGAILVAVGASASFTGGTMMTGSSAALGGAIAVTASSPAPRTTPALPPLPPSVPPSRLSVSGSSRVWGNSAQILAPSSISTAACGGAIYVAGVASVEISGSATVADNTATNLGGGVALDNGGGCGGWPGTLLASKYGSPVSLTLDGAAVVSNNAAGQDGGALYARGNFSLSIAGTAVLASNLASRNGGAICLVSSATASIHGASRLRNNSAATGGGGVYLSASSLVVSGSAMLVSNSAGSGGGGAICGVSSSAVVLTGGALVALNTANTATASGGGASLTASTLTMNDTAAFVSNSAKKAAIFNPRPFFCYSLLSDSWVYVIVPDVWDYHIDG